MIWLEVHQFQSLSQQEDFHLKDRIVVKEVNIIKKQKFPAVRKECNFKMQYEKIP